MDVGGVIEYYTRRGPVVRFDPGDTTKFRPAASPRTTAKAALA
ncbi:MAG TPA: hypothetical protein VE422_31655 [Terriglobia bacterium]|nr:hypothetical protein [Terriglobia bacterium]